MLLSLTQTAFLSIFKLCQVGLDDSPADLAGDDDQLLLAPRPAAVLLRLTQLQHM